ncbi:MAG: hypothetical protein WCF84_25070 [Anaerolineae bacterium]
MPHARILLRVLWGGVMLGLLFYLGLTLWLALSGIFFPYELDYGEGIVLWFTRELALGHSIYKGIEGLPYASSNYPPLAMLLAAPFRVLFGDSYTGGRWLNFASALIVAAFLFRIVKTEIRGLARPPRLLISSIAALLFLGSTFIYHWIPLFRIDLIGLAFTVAGLFFVWRWQGTGPRAHATGHTLQATRRQPTARDTNRAMGKARNLQPATWNLGLAALFFLCALYTKHSLFVAPAAAAVAIFLRDRRMAILWTLVLGASGMLILTLLNWWTSGGFIFGMVASNATLWLWDTFLTLAREFVTTYLLLILLAVWGWTTRLRARRIGVLELYGAGAIGSVLLAGRVGAWENYLFEAVVVVCLFAGIAIGAGWEHRPSARWWLPVALLVQLMLFWDKHDPAIARQLMDEVRTGNQNISSLVAHMPGTVISEDMGLLVTNGKPVDYYTFQYSSLARAGAWNQHWELENLQAGHFPLVILNRGTREDVDHFRNFTREFMSALDEGYRLSYQNVRYEVYQPAPLSRQREVDFDGQLKLVGWTAIPARTLHAGDTLGLDLVWQAERKLDLNYTAFVHLEDTQGSVPAQDDHAPRVGFGEDAAPYPTTRWAANEMKRESFTLKFPATLAPGVYSIRAGWYEPESGDRLSVKSGDDFVELAQIEVH